MKDQSTTLGGLAAGATHAPSLPAAGDRATFQGELDRLRVREKAHSREGDAIAARPGLEQSITDDRGGRSPSEPSRHPGREEPNG